MKVCGIETSSLLGFCLSTLLLTRSPSLVLASSFRGFLPATRGCNCRATGFSGEGNCYYHHHHHYHPGAFVYRPERIASCTQRAASSPRRLPRLVIARRFTDQRFTTRPALESATALSRSDFARFFFHSADRPARQVDGSTTYLAPSSLPTPWRKSRPSLYGPSRFLVTARFYEGLMQRCFLPIVTVS